MHPLILSILDLIIKAVVGIFTGILALLPDVTLPSSVTAWSSSIGSGFGAANAFFPLTTLGLCIAAVIAVRLLLSAYSLVVWLYEKIPFKFT
jgi:hypothetical protein